MSITTLTPISQTSRITLPATGTLTNVADSLPFAVPQYIADTSFLSGATDQVAFTYKMFGGEVLDIEITECQVYAAYEYATLEYSSMINSHQARNVLSDVLGFPTGTFDQDGELKAGSELSSSLSGASLAVMYPDFSLHATLGINRAIATEAGVGGTKAFYSASVPINAGTQDYDLQARVETLAASGSGERFEGLVGDNRITIRRVWYRTPRAMWRFYGYYGGLNAIGNMSTYGQYSDDSTFEVIPAWQNKAQAMAYEDNLWTRISHYSFELRDNKVRVFPMPSTSELLRLWFEFTIDDADVYNLNTSGSVGQARNRGVNNINTVPFANIPYCNINSMGKQWIRRFALAISKEQLGLVRSKLDSIPLPGDKVTLNGPALVEAGVAEQDKLRDSLAEYLDKVTYNALAEQRAELVENADRVNHKIPMSIFVG